MCESVERVELSVTLASGANRVDGENASGFGARIARSTSGACVSLSRAGCSFTRLIDGVVFIGYSALGA